MTSLNREIRKSSQRLKTRKTMGLLGREGDSLLRSTDGRYYVRERLSSGRYAPAIALPLDTDSGSVIIQYNMPVELGYNNTRGRVILGHNTGMLMAQGINPIVTNMGDPQNLTTRLGQIDTLRGRPSQDNGEELFSEVLPGKTYVGTTLINYAGGTIDISGDRPAAGQHLYSLTALKPDGTLESATSTTQAVASALGDTDLQEAATALSDGSIPIKAYTLTNALAALDGASSSAPEMRPLIISAHIDHGDTYGRTDDDHSIYLLLAGRASGQSAFGGIATGENLVLDSTAHATKGSVLLAGSLADFDEEDRFITFTGKILSGSFGSPIDVTVTREYGVELHYSGDNYNVTALRARSQLITTDTSAASMGALLQGANTDGIDAGTIRGALIEGIGKSDSTSSTIGNLEGLVVNTEWNAKETITDVKTLHVRSHTRNSAGEGRFTGDGYLIYIENEAVGGNGQMFDAGIYLKATNVSTPQAFDYGIDLTGAAGEIATADILLADGSTLSGDLGSVLASTLQINVATLTDEALILKTTDDDVTKNLLEVKNGSDATVTLIDNLGGLFIGKISTLTSGDFGIDSSYITNVGSNVNNQQFAVQAFIQKQGAGNQSGSINGLRGFAYQAGSGTITNLIGVDFLVRAVGAGIGNVALAKGFQTQIVNSTVAIIANAYGMFLKSATNTGGGAINNLYGLFIEDQTVGSNVNFAIQTGLGDVQFGDQVSIIGSDAADVQLAIKGAAAQSVEIFQAQNSSGEEGVTISPDAKELRFYDPGASNYVGFEAPALIGNQIWVLPDADGVDGDVMFTDGAGNLKWGANASTRAFTFSSPSGGSGTTYAAGHYRFGATDNDFNPSITFGAANGAYGDHIFLVAAAGASGGTDTVVRVTGTSMQDDTTRTPGDTEDLTLDDAGAAGAYYETAKKWVGQVTIEKISGPDLLCNYGGVKYWDDNNEDFKVAGLDVTWLGGANDAGAELLLRHHKATGWTYNIGAAPTPPAAIASMNADYVTEIDVVNGEEGAWKQTNLTTNVAGSDSEGIFIEIITSANKTFEIGNFLIRVVPQ